MMKPSVAYVDDDPKNLKSYEAILSSHFEVKTFLTPDLLLENLETTTFDCLLVDIYMPKMDGLGVLKNVRSSKLHETLPVIMITTNPSDENKVSSFVNGATDFVDRMTSKSELIARIESKIAFSQRMEGTIQIGNLTINKKRLEIRIGDHSPELSLNEIRILFKLAGDYPHRVPKADLLQHIWGKKVIHDNNLNAQLYNLRLKLADWDHSITNTKLSGLGFEAK
jgi:DNA-binding response OmpR family regulator